MDQINVQYWGRARSRPNKSSPARRRPKDNLRHKCEIIGLADEEIGTFTKADNDLDGKPPSNISAGRLNGRNPFF